LFDEKASGENIEDKERGRNRRQDKLYIRSSKVCIFSTNTLTNQEG
jgi:hypothetical protein